MSKQKNNIDIDIKDELNKKAELKDLQTKDKRAQDLKAQDKEGQMAIDPKESELSQEIDSLETQKEILLNSESANFVKVEDKKDADKEVKEPIDTADTDKAKSDDTDFPKSLAKDENNKDTANRATFMDTKDTQKNIIYTSKSHTGAILTTLAVVTAAFAFISYDFFNKINDLQVAQNNSANIQEELREAQSLVKVNLSKIDTLLKENQNLTSTNEKLVADNKELESKINALIAREDVNKESITTLQERLDKYESSDPNAWKVAESFFLVKQAVRETLIDGDVVSSIHLLDEADKLLVNIQSEDILKAREALAADIVTLKNIKEVDTQGIAFAIDALYGNVDKLTLKGYSDPKTRAEAFSSDAQKTDSFADWKNNLLTSAKEFSTRFVEIRRRNDNAATEFLSPEQDYFLRENIKARFTLATMALSTGDSKAYTQHLTIAHNYVATYFDPESTSTKATLEGIDKLINTTIEIDIPNTLQSYAVFDAIFAKSGIAK